MIVLTVGPIQEIVLEKFAFHLIHECYGITDWTLKFGVVDWRDDEVIELIRDQRIRNGTWTINRARGDVGEPPIDGGDEAVLVDRQNMVLWQDIHDLSKANLGLVQAQVKTANMPVMGKTNPGGKDVSVGDGSDKPKGKPKQAPKKIDTLGAPSGTESVQELREEIREMSKVISQLVEKLNDNS